MKCIIFYKHQILCFVVQLLTTLGAYLRCACFNAHARQLRERPSAVVSLCILKVNGVGYFVYSSESMPTSVSKQFCQYHYIRHSCRQTCCDSLASKGQTACLIVILQVQRHVVLCLQFNYRFQVCMKHLGTPRDSYSSFTTRVVCLYIRIQRRTSLRSAKKLQQHT